MRRVALRYPCLTQMRTDASHFGNSTWSSSLGMPKCSAAAALPAAVKCHGNRYSGTRPDRLAARPARPQLRSVLFPTCVYCLACGIIVHRRIGYWSLRDGVAKGMALAYSGFWYKGIWILENAGENIISSVIDVFGVVARTKIGSDSVKYSSLKKWQNGAPANIRKVLQRFQMICGRCAVFSHTAQS